MQALSLVDFLYRDHNSAEGDIGHTISIMVVLTKMSELVNTHLLTCLAFEALLTAIGVAAALIEIEIKSGEKNREIMIE